jgi:hypothetical protein
MDITGVNSRRETLNSRYAINRRDANNSTGMSKGTPTAAEKPETIWTPVMRIFAKNSSEWQKFCEKV